MKPTQSEGLLQSISRLDDDELLRVLDSPDGEYTTEALAFAQEELERRGGRPRLAERLPHYVPTPKPAAALEGIAGWLILPLVGLCLGMAGGVMSIIQLAIAFHAHPRTQIGLCFSCSLFCYCSWRLCASSS